MAENKKIKKCPVSLQPDIENLLQDLTPDDFASASSQEKEDFIQDRQSVSYWKDAWRRLKKNVVAMVALGVIIFLFLFAFVGPLLIPYGYDEFNDGAENLFPYHYTLEDQQRVDEEIASRTQSEVVDVDSMFEQAKAEAEAKGEKFTKKDEAILRAKAKTAAKNDTASESEESTDPDTVRKELGIKKHIFGYSKKELERKAAGEKVFPHVFGTDMYGRDILVRVMYGARVSMSVGVFAALLVLIIGALYGAISGYCGGKVDAVMQRIVELIYAVPEMLVVLLIATALKPILTEYINSPGGGPLKSFANVLGPNLISMFIAFASVLGNYEPYHPWTGTSAETAGICNSSQSTRCFRRTYHPSSSASELYRTDRCNNLPADPVCDLPGVIPFLSWCWCICTASKPWIYGNRRIKRYVYIHLQTDRSVCSPQCNDSCI